jgi:L-threonylcarbamoyladenylate synthase
MTNQPKVAAILQNGGIGVIATDTLYGIVGRALDKPAVNRIYRLKRRHPDKPFIILISDYGDLASFNINLTPALKRQLNSYWPGPVSVVLPCPHASLAYLHRGKKSLAFRLPAKKTLRSLLKLTGPLVAPSANPEGHSPAQTISQARSYFENTVDFYRPGQTGPRPSRLIRLSETEAETLRN